MEFKTCGKCGTVWSGRNEYLADGHIEFLGYQVDFASVQTGFFLFNHTIPGCQTTMAVDVPLLADLSPRPVFEPRPDPGPDPKRYCLYSSSGMPCPHSCECRFVQDLCKTIRAWPKELRTRKAGGDSPEVT